MGTHWLPGAQALVVLPEKKAEHRVRKRVERTQFEAQTKTQGS